MVEGGRWKVIIERIKAKGGWRMVEATGSKLKVVDPPFFWRTQSTIE